MSLYSAKTARAVATFSALSAVSTTPITFAVWVKMQTAPIATNSARMYNAGTAASDPYRASTAAGGSALVMPGTDTAFYGGTGVWEHLAMVISSSTIRDFYLNGTVVARQSGTRDVSGIVRASFLGVASSGENVASAMDGYVAYGAIWNTALTAGNITSLQTLSPDQVGTPIHYWPMNGADLAACKVASIGGANLTEFGTGLARSADNPSISTTGGGNAPRAAALYRMLRNA
jgi:hypothetical protein